MTSSVECMFLLLYKGRLNMLIPNTIQGTLKSIDELIAKLQLEIPLPEDEIRSRRTKRNGLSPIYRLPPEILAEIFMFYRDNCPDPLWRFPELPATWLEWTQVAQVSHHWREAALSHPPLWARLMVEYGPWSEEMLKRSKTALLDVLIPPPPTPEGERLVKTLISQPERLERLQIVLSSMPMQKMVAPFFHSPAQNLKVLTLKAETRPFTLPSDLFGGDAPRLRSLTLTPGDCATWKCLLPFKCLASLKLDFAYFEARRTPDDFLDVLERIPTLRELDVKIDLTDVEVEWERVHSAVHLRNLQQFALSTGSVKHLATFLKWIVMPATVSIALQGRCMTETDEGFTQDLIAALNSNCWAGPIVTSASPTSLVSLAFEVVGWGVAVSGWFHGVNVEEHGVREGFKHFGLQLEGPSCSAATTNLLHSLPTTHVSSIYLEQALDSADLALLSSLPNLERVHLYRQNATKVLAWIREDPSQHFLRARIFTFTQVEFVPDEGEGNSDAVDLDDLIDTINVIQLERKGKGEILEVCLRWCTNVDRDQVAQIRHAIPEFVRIEWDGVVFRSSSEV
ncbi:hypothetical protein BKA70DRAFT_1254403 [Coprinopsis sp. MPI-PUGE-AT-0042]|nr:hypothetical protein BKA70DRAFT_1254403 [Coprinopsis sp. MPI-PUGE-AT-0042]